MYLTGFNLNKRTGQMDLTGYTLVNNTEKEISSAVSEYMFFMESKLPVTRQQIMVNSYRKDSVYNNVKSSVFNVKNTEDLRLLYRNARHFLDKGSFVCDFYIKNNWEEDLMNHKINL